MYESGIRQPRSRKEIQRKAENLKCSLFPFKFFRCHFDIRLEIVFAGGDDEFVRRAIGKHEQVELLAFEAGEAFHQTFIETVVNEFIFLLLDEALLEFFHGPVLAELEKPDQLLDVNACAHGADGGNAFNVWAAEVKGLCIILTVLQRIHPVTAVFNLNLIEYLVVSLEGNVEPAYIVDLQYREFLCGLAQVGKPDGIFFSNINGVLTLFIGNGSFSRGAEHTHQLDRTVVAAVVYRSLYLVLGACGCSQQQQEASCQYIV